MEWLLVIAGVVLGLMFIGTSYSGDGGGCGGCLLIIIVLILGVVVLTR
jgi:hypothetical protein